MTCLKRDFIAFKVDIISKENNVVTDGIMTLCASNQVLCNVCSYDFYDIMLSTEKQRRHMINSIVAFKAN